MVEGSFAGEHFIGEHPHCPHIYKVIIALSGQKVRTDVVEGATIGVPAFFAVGGPAQIAQLAQSLCQL